MDPCSANPTPSPEKCYSVPNPNAFLCQDGDFGIYPIVYTSQSVPPQLEKKQLRQLIAASIHFQLKKAEEKRRKYAPVDVNHIFTIFQQSMFVYRVFCIIKFWYRNSILDHPCRSAANVLASELQTLSLR